MHIVLVTECLWPELGGVGKVAYFVAKALSDQGVRVSVIARTERIVAGIERLRVSEGFDIYQYNRTGGLWFRDSGKRVLDVMAQYASEIGRPNAFYYQFPYAVRAVAELYPESKHILHIHSPVLEEGLNSRGWLYWPLLRYVERAYEYYAIQESRYCVVLSDYLSNLLKEKYETIPDRKFVKLRSGLVRNESRSSTKPKSVLRRCYQIPIRAKVMIVARRHVNRTGVLDLADAVSRFCHDPRVFFVITGDGPLRSKIERTLHNQGNVMITGTVSDASLDDLISLSDVSIVPTKALECFGLITLESIDRGVPVIATDNSANPELIDALGGGTIIPFGVNSFVDIISRFVDGQIRFPTIDRGRLANYTFEQHAMEFLNLIRCECPGHV